MRIRLSEDDKLIITPESSLEAYALKHWQKDHLESESETYGQIFKLNSIFIEGIKDEH